MSRQAAEVRTPALPLLAAAGLASCATPPEPATRTAEAQRDFDLLTAGKTAGAPLACVPTVITSDMKIVDGRTIAYRLGSRTTYIVHLSGGCSGITSGYTLVTEHFGGNGPCRGDAARVVDLTSRIPVGSCMVKEIVPYTQAS